MENFVIFLAFLAGFFWQKIFDLLRQVPVRESPPLALQNREILPIEGKVNSNSYITK